MVAWSAGSGVARTLMQLTIAMRAQQAKMMMIVAQIATVQLQGVVEVAMARVVRRL